MWADLVFLTWTRARDNMEVPDQPPTFFYIDKSKHLGFGQKFDTSCLPLRLAAR